MSVGRIMTLNVHRLDQKIMAMVPIYVVVDTSGMISAAHGFVRAMRLVYIKV